MARYILLSDDYPLQRKRPTTFANFVHSVALGEMANLNDLKHDLTLS